MKGKTILIVFLWLAWAPSLHGEILSGELMTKGETSFVVRDSEGKDHHLRFDDETTFTVLTDSKETKVKDSIRIAPGSKVMAFEDEGYAIYFQLICKSAGGTTACVPTTEKK